HKTDQPGWFGALHRADRDKRGEEAPIFAARFEFPALAGCVNRICGYVTPQVIDAVRVRHQHADVGSDHFPGRISEESFRRTVEFLDAALLIDDEDANDRGIQESPQFL